MPTKDEMDEFWSIDKLVPKKKTVKPFATEIKCADVTLSGNSSADSNDGKLTFSSMTVEDKLPDREYTPENNSFIKSVKIKHSLDRYDFYGSFRKAALVYFDYKTERCDYTPFYSYLPQYSQLTLPQKNYYFFWRSELRYKRYLKADYSYITLYAFEILNLADKIPPNEGIKLLCDVWEHYRSQCPRMDTDFSVWVQDYCLVHGLSAPCELISGFLHEIIRISPLKEFYLSDYSHISTAGKGVFLSALTDYDWRRGKYSSGETAALYEKHMLGAMGSVIFDMWYSGDLLRSLNQIEKIRRQAFPKSICTHKVKCDLEIEYTPISSSTLREKITGAVRYCENKLRALLGIKSRLAVKDMDRYYAHIIDKYFETLYKEQSEKRRKESQPEYEKLYDAPKGKLSFGGAAEIEQSSWQTTARLVSELEPDEIIPVAEPQADTDFQASAVQATLGDVERRFLESCLAGENPPDTLENGALAQNINEALYDELSDIVIELTDSGYAVIEDYREDAERLLYNA